MKSMWDKYLALKENAKKTKKLLNRKKSDLQVSGSGILTQKSREKDITLDVKTKTGYEELPIPEGNLCSLCCIA
jgi:hypothetical protein